MAGSHILIVNLADSTHEHSSPSSTTTFSDLHMPQFDGREDAPDLSGTSKGSEILHTRAQHQLPVQSGRLAVAGASSSPGLVGRSEQSSGGGGFDFRNHQFNNHSLAGLFLVSFFSYFIFCFGFGLVFVFHFCFCFLFYLLYFILF